MITIEQVNPSSKLKDKLCQSCIERGYNPPNIASREWQTDYFICEDCYTPLLNNILSENYQPKLEQLIERSLGERPILSLIYELLEIPVELQLEATDSVLSHREQIFNHHANAVVNLTEEQVKENIETWSVVLFQIKIYLETNQDYLNKLKSDIRASQNLVSPQKQKSAKEAVKTGTSKVKLSKDAKMAKAMGLTLEKYTEMCKYANAKKYADAIGSTPELVLESIKEEERPKVAQVNSTEEITVTNSTKQGICNKPFLVKGKPIICNLPMNHSGSHDRS